MDGIFSSNNPVMRFMTNLFNIFWLNLLFIFTSLPIITIGASLCGLYKVCLSMVSGEDPSVTKMYFTEFKDSFKRGTILWVMVVVLGAFFSLELYWIYFRPDLIPSSMSFLQYPVWIMLFGVTQLFLYGFALLATFENTFKNTLINSIALSIKYFPITIMLIAIHLFTPLLINTFQQYMILILSFELFFNLSLRAYICSLFLHRAFGLKKIKIVKDGEMIEESYEDMIEFADDKDDSEESEDEDENTSSDESEDEDDSSDEDPDEKEEVTSEEEA